MSEANSESQTTERPFGWYWVKYGNEAVPAGWVGGAWWLPGVQGPIDEAAATMIQPLPVPEVSEA